MQSTTSIRLFRVSDAVVCRIRRSCRAALSFVLATALLPLPSAVGGTLGSAFAAPVSVPFYAIDAYPDNSTSVRAPQGVTVAPNNDVIIADTGNHRVRILDSTGMLKASFGSKGSTTGRLLNPGAVALGPDDLIYVADTGNSRVQVFERDGTFVRAWGSRGIANGQFAFPEGIAVGVDGRVYVSDTENARVAVFSATGAFLETWGDSPGQFDRPSGIAVDSAGYVYVVDSNKRQVMKFEPSVSRTSTNWGWTDTSTPRVSRYTSPTGISLSQDGNSLIIADTGNFRIERCELDGDVLESLGALPDNLMWSLFDSPRSGAMNSTGTLVIADTGNDRIQRRSPAGTWAAPWSTPSTMTPNLSAPEAVAADLSTGVNYVADTGNSRILKYGVSGDYLGTVAGPGPGPGQVSSPKGLLVLADGTLLVSDTGNNRIQRYSAAGSYLGSFGQVAGAGQVSAPRGLAVSDSGTLFVADTGKNRVAKFSTATWLYESMIGSATAGSALGQFNQPRGVAVSGDVLWVADTGNNRVQKFAATSGAYLGKVGSRGVNVGQMYQPAAVMADGTEVVVADTGNNRLVRYADNLTLLSTYDGTNTRVGSMWEPASLVPTQDGRTLALERAGCRIQVLLRDGIAPVTTVTSTASGPTRAATVRLTFSATDVGSAVAGTYARVDGVAQPVSGSLDLSVEGTHTVAFWSVDLAENLESEQTTQVVIDRTAPVGTMQVAGGSSVTSMTAVAVSSAVSGVNQMRIAVDTAPVSAWVAYSTAATATLPAVDGTHTVYAEYRDEAGNVRSLERDILLDRVGPTLTGLTSPTHPTGLPTWGPGELNWSVPSDPSGIAGYAVSIDVNPVGAPTASITTSSTAFMFSALTSGTWYAHAMARDRAGNWGPVASISLEGRSDFGAPETIATGVPSRETSANVTVALTATDTVSGPAGIRHRKDGGAETTYTAPIAFTTEGAHTLSFYALDRAGNVELEQDVAFRIDRTAPVGAMQLAGGSSVTSKTAIAVSSAVSGANQMRIAVDTAPASTWVTYSNAATVMLPALDGTHTVYAEYRDEAGNVLSLQRDIRLDRTGPTVVRLTSSSHLPGVPTWGTAELSWDSATDPSGVTGYAISIDSDPAGVPTKTITTSQLTTTFPTLATGTWYVHAMARDELGNWGPVTSIALEGRSDVTPPETTATGVPIGPSPTAVTISLESTDTVSGVETIYYRRDGGIESVYTTPLRFSSEGAHALTFRAVDHAGNSELEQSIAFAIDYLAPVGTFALDAAAALTATTTVNVLSSVEGANQMRIAVDTAPASAWVAYNTAATVTLPAVDGTHTVYAEYLDEAGNVLLLEADIRLDRTGPTVVGLTSSSHLPGVPTWGSVRVAWDAATDLSGVTGYAISIDSDPAGVPTKTITASQLTTTFPTLPTGRWYVHAMARDGLGNWGQVTSIALEGRSDFGAPQTTATGVPSRETSANVTVALSATDTVSGPAGIRYRKDGGVETTYTAPIIFTIEGKHAVSFRAVDNAGNLEAAQVVVFTIDRTKPRVSQPAYAARPAGDTLLVAWSSAPDLSGVVGYAIAFDTSPATVPAAIVATDRAEFAFPASSRQRYLHIRAIDAAGNWGDVVHFDTWPKPVRLSRPTVVRAGGTPRPLVFTVTGSIESSAATGVVRVVLERRTAGGAWKTYRVLENVPLRPVAGTNRAAYRSERITFRTPRYVPRGSEWRARTVWAGNGVLRPVGSAYSRVIRLR